MNFASPTPATATERRRWSIRAQLVWLVLAVVIPATGLVIYALQEAANEAREASRARLQALATLTVSRLDYLVRDETALFEQLARRPRIRALDARDCDPVLAQLVAVNPHYMTLAVRDRHGRVICSSRTDPLGAEVVSQLPWFRQGIADAGTRMDDAFLHPRTGRWVAVLTHAFTDDAGEAVGLLVLSLDLLSLQEHIMEGLPEGARVAVIDRQGVFLMRFPDPGKWIGKPLPATRAGSALARKDGEAYEMRDLEGDARMYTSARVPSAGWRVIASQSLDVAAAPHRDRLRRSAAIGGAALLLIAAMAYGIGAAIARPIAALAKVASSLRAGGAGAAAPTQGAAEIEAVAGELVRLADERERQRGERVSLMAHYERRLKSTRDIYLLIDGDNRIADFNDAALTAYGRTADELRGLPVVELRTPEARAGYERDWREVARAGGHLYETVHRRRDGSAFDVEVSSSEIVIEGMVYRQSFIRDITARKEADALLRQHNAELDRFNRAAVGRELEMIDLKRRINALSAELGRDPPYPLAFLNDDGRPPPRA